MGIAGRTPITYDYDADGLVARGGALTLERDLVTGAITGDTIGVVATSRTYDDHGALSGIELRVQALVTWSQRLTRDWLGNALVTRRVRIAVRYQSYQLPAMSTKAER